MQYQEILKFWFEDVSGQQYWAKDNDFDDLIRKRFADIHKQASSGELVHWRVEPEGRLAEIIILDQFSRNIYRDDKRAFAYDGMALVLSQQAIALEVQKGFGPLQKTFLYLPFMHSESPAIHKQAVELFSEPGLENNYQFELAHKAIVDRFGRYPHRNSLLGRESTAEELEFLKQPNSSF